MSRLRVVVGALVALVVVTASPAAADPIGGGGGGSTSDVTYAEASGCRMYASSYGYGIFCPTSGGVTAKDMLRGERAPTCWHVLPYAGWEPPEEILDPEQGTWRLKTCLTGYDEEGNPTGPPQFSFEYVFVPGGQEITLTEAQENFVAFINDDRKLPLPVVAVSPVAAPRVGNDVAFFIVEGAPGETSIPEINGIQMRAWQVRLDVVPGGGGVHELPWQGHPGRGDRHQGHPPAGVLAHLPPLQRRLWRRPASRPIPGPLHSSLADRVLDRRGSHVEPPARGREDRPNSTARHRGPDLGHPLRETR